MPNQNPNQNQQDNPVTPVVNPDPIQIDPQGSIPVQNDLPPLPDYMTQTDTNGVQENTSAPVIENAPTEQQTSDDLSGSAAPSDLPPMVSTPKKKFGGKRIIATILGIFLLVGGIGAGIILTQQQQLFQQKAEGTGYGGGCVTGLNGNIVCGSTNVPYDPDNPPPGVNSGYRSEEDAVWGCGGGNYHQGSNGNYYCGEGGGGGGGGGGGTNPTPTPGPSASCQSVKAYSSSSATSTWTLLTSSDLSRLTGGAVINFCVAGTADTGSFDKAQFTIAYFTGGEDGVVEVMPETTTKRPGSEDFCQSFTIPLGTNSITATAKIHHVTLGWK